MAADFGPLGIRVNAIAPGEIDTAILSPGTEKIVEQIPLHRLGTPDEVAKIIYVLCTETVVLRERRRDPHQRRPARVTSCDGSTVRTSWWSRTRRRSASSWSTIWASRTSASAVPTAVRRCARLCERELPALVLLDVGLPGEDGFALARWLRERSGRIGIIMVTAASDTVDRVVGLETGADDYIAKPFEPRELLARVKSVLRRVTGATADAPGRACAWAVACSISRSACWSIRPTASEETLAASEFDLLKVFAENPNRPLNRDWLLEVTAHREMEAFDRAIDLRITRLRRKIEGDAAHPDAIRTVRGVGYMFVPPKD